MAPLLAIALLFLGGAVFVFTARSLITHRAGMLWWLLLLVTTGAGVVIGAWAGQLEYTVSGELRIVSFPIPAVFVVLETDDNAEQQWVDFVVPAPFLVVISNVVFVASLSVIPIWAANSMSARKRDHAVDAEMGT